MRTFKSSKHDFAYNANEVKGGCSKGDKCTFAHSLEELRHAPDLKKTKLCQLYESGNDHDLADLTDIYFSH